MMTRYAVRLLRNADDADDVVSAALAKAWDRRDAIDPKRNPAAYLMRMVRNMAYDLMRSANRRRNTPLEYAHAAQDGRGEPIDTLITLESHAAALARLRSLPPVYEAVFRDVYLLRLTYAECAKKRRLGLQNVARICFRVKKHLGADKCLIINEKGQK